MALSPSEEKALRAEMEKIKRQNEMMKKLSSTSGFFDEYFKELKNHKFCKDAFDVINENYFNLFSVYKYSSYESFKSVQYKNHVKNKKI